MVAHKHSLKRSPWWQDWSSLDFSAVNSRTVALLPVAATEQHGPHLPTGVDCMIMQSILESSLPHFAADTQPLILPLQSVGKSNEHQSYAGTLSLSTETVLRLWLEIGACVARSGIQKLLIFNSHGGHNGLIECAARDLRAEHNLLCFASHWYNLPLNDSTMAPFSAHERRFGVHAGALETSCILHSHPHLVKRQHLAHFHSTAEQRSQQFTVLGNGRSAKMGWRIEDYNPLGACGDASAAQADHGQALIADAGCKLALLVSEIADLPWPTPT